MELIQPYVPFLGMVIMVLTLPWTLAWWLEHFAWFRCLENWLWYGRWIGCTHPVQQLQRYGPAIPHHKDTEVWDFACQACGTVFLRDTWGQWEAQAARPSWWHRLCHTVRRMS